MNRLRLRSWQRFIALFLASLIVFTQTVPAFGQLPATQPPSIPAPVPANQNVAPPFAANDNIRPYTGKVPGKVSAGVAIRGITPWLVEAAEGVALFGISVGETILFFQWMGKTNVTWDDIYDTLKSGDYQPLASPSQAKQPAPAAEYPCEKSTANYPGKLEADSPKTAGEIELFDTLRKVTGGLIQDNFLYRFGSEVVDAKRLSALYGVKAELWAEHRIYGNLTDSKGRRVFLRFFRNQYTVIDYEYKLLAECEEKKEELPVLLIDSGIMPTIAKHIRAAIAAGKPDILTYLGGPNNPVRGQNQKAACKGFKKTLPNGSCDEYPFASTFEGGAGASVMEVPLPEQRSQAAVISNFYQHKLKLEAGKKFKVVVK